MFRFTIRDVLWLTVVVALGVGWFAQFKAAANQSKARKSWEATARAIAIEFTEATQCPIELHGNGKYTVSPPPAEDMLNVQ